MKSDSDDRCCTRGGWKRGRIWCGRLAGGDDLLTLPPVRTWPGVFRPGGGDSGETRAAAVEGGTARVCTPSSTCARCQRERWGQPGKTDYHQMLECGVPMTEGTVRVPLHVGSAARFPRVEHSVPLCVCSIVSSCFTVPAFTVIFPPCPCSVMCIASRCTYSTMFVCWLVA